MSAGAPPVPIAEAERGVSVVIPCHNGARRLPRTLKHLSAQQVPAGIPWEVILVDNGCTDRSADFARQQWDGSRRTPLRVVHEPRLGASYARMRGANSARYEYIGFVDDDNWPAPRFVHTLFEVLSAHPGVGACGGASVPAFDAPPPAWFERYQSNYAVGPQSEAPGDVTVSRGYLWGAGMGLRRRAWRQLADSGFRPRLSDRRGRALSSGGDCELTLALRLADWRLRYEPRLQLTHAMPRDRLTGRYLGRLFYGFGCAAVIQHAYQAVLASSLTEPGDAWRALALKSTRAFRRHAAGLARCVCNAELVFDGTMQIAHDLGTLTTLLRRRREFEQAIVELRNLRRRLAGLAHAQQLCVAAEAEAATRISAMP